MAEPKKNPLNVAAVCTAIIMVAIAVRGRAPEPAKAEDVAGEKIKALTAEVQSLTDRVKSAEAQTLELKGRLAGLQAEVDDLAFKPIPKRVVGPGAAGSAN